MSRSEAKNGTRLRFPSERWTRHWDLKKIRWAIVVSTSKLAYLAWLAFGEEGYRVFYNDISAAIDRLSKESAV